MKRKFTKITALLVTVALLMAVPTLSAYANEENTTAVLSESAAQSTTNNIKESTTVPEDRQTTDNQESTTDYRTCKGRNRIDPIYGRRKLQNRRQRAVSALS